MGKQRPGKRDRADFKKNHQVRTRRGDFTRRFRETDGEALEDEVTGERVTGKGDLTRRRVLNVGVGDNAAVTRAHEQYMSGRVLCVYGLTCRVHGDDGQTYKCAVRRVLKSVSTDERQVIAAGDRVIVRIEAGTEGIVDSVEPRTGGVLSRMSKNRRHVLAANVDRMLIVASVAEPTLKPHLIDRFLLTAEQFQIRPVICFNKVDLIDRFRYRSWSAALHSWGIEHFCVLRPLGKVFRT